MLHSTALVTRRTARLVLDVLRSEGVTHVFGNPGSTEMPLMDALVDCPDITYVLGLQEATAVGMADGYAMATGRPSFVNLHTAGGLGNAMGVLFSSATTRTPMVVTAGQQDTRHLFRDPWLSGDLVSMARPVTKWAAEIKRAEDVPAALRRAFAIARTPPMGPVFLSLPMDVLDQEIEVPENGRPIPETRDRRTADVGAVAELLSTRDAARVAVVLGTDLAEDVAAGVLALTHTAGYAVYGTQLASRTAYSSSDPCWQGFLKPDFAMIRRTLALYDTVLLMGSRAFIAYPYRNAEPLSGGTTFIHFADNDAAIGAEVPADLSVVGDLRTTLVALSRALAPRIDRFAVAERLETLRKASAERAAAARAAILQDRSLPLTPDAAILAVIDSLPADTLIVNESAATFGRVQDVMPISPGRHFFSSGGVLGCGMPFAVGAALAGDGQVACLTGDGATLYSPQALWSAAHHGRRIMFFVFNNTRYEILMRVARDLGYRNATAGRFVGMDLSDPIVDFQRLARSFGVPAYRAGTAEDIATVVAEASLLAGPSLIEIPIR
ncbi:thiamine pyrophosphate-binding protein [Arenibaculum pallidiluteum]|uniref:thiamine pyrophosphate-binding protein n=1 Tax=Arenibaculum pallidiluteum TaxID=2812559 RepID=UPI001A969876|nr:thiamine pyrophosphate-binding protein [Arenibaculum pallidiluteum]